LKSKTAFIRLRPWQELNLRMFKVIDSLGLIIQNSQMLISRDFLHTLSNTNSQEAILLWGPRQVGKTTLLDQLAPKSSLYLDDLALREASQADPALVLNNLETPCLIDEAQYAPNLFPELKLRIDKLRRDNLKTSKKRNTFYYLTGSNKLLLDEKIKESLAGRCSLYTLHGLSFKEILSYDPNLSIKSVLFRGGFPDLYTQEDISVSKYLNDYIVSFIEKDIARTAGVQKINEFQTVLRLLAARTGQFLNVNEIANSAGVEQKTVQSWIDLLQKNLIIELVDPYFSNLSKRITKMKKLYFYDVGLCARLQGYHDEESLWNSPQVGSLFETMVFSEIVKTKDNFLKNWNLYTWRTKEQNEIDFILQDGRRFLFIESKLGIHGVKPFELDVEAKKVFKESYQKVITSVGLKKTQLSSETLSVPISFLGEYLKNF
jgi:predicted AAA+ superfamily ATPase